MISPLLQSLIDAPLASATRTNVPGGKSAAPRSKQTDLADDIGCPKLSSKALRERKAKAAADKLSALFDYYAGTNLTAEKVAEHKGLYRREETGRDKDGNPIFSRVLDVQQAEQQISWRRKAA